MNEELSLAYERILSSVDKELSDFGNATKFAALGKALVTGGLINQLDERGFKRFLVCVEGEFLGFYKNKSVGKLFDIT